MSALIILIKSPHAQGADVACPMVARGDGLVDHGASAYKADLGLDVIVIVVAVGGGGSGGGGGAQLGLP